MKKWLPLKKNDIVDIIAPSSSKKYDLIGLKEFINKLGLRARISDDIINENGFYLSNTDQYRLNNLKAALCSRDSKLIWCLTGGYGSTILIPELFKLNIPSTAKAFIGFSDITALHLFLNQHWSWPTIHGRMLADLSKNYDNQLLTSFKSLLFDQAKLQYKLTPLNDIAKANILINSQLIGGNLCIVENSLATNWQIKANNKILFLEEVDESPYRIDRSFEHLFQAGIFNGIKALIIGAITYKDRDNSNKIIIDFAINRLVQKLAIPIFSISYIGHYVDNPPLPLGSNVVLKIIDNQTFLECNIV